jgi:GNAT superfamily N-acetyltransferase
MRQAPREHKIDLVTLKGENQVGIRPFQDDDLKFVMSSWLNSFKSSAWAGPIQNNRYWTVYQAVIEQLLARDGVGVLVACNPEKPYQIFGYIVAEQGFDLPVAHWIYVKQPLRGLGIARALMASCGIIRETRFYYTFRTSACAVLFAHTGPWPGAKFNTSIVRKRKGDRDEVAEYLVSQPVESPAQGSGERPAPPEQVGQGSGDGGQL